MRDNEFPYTSIVDVVKDLKNEAKGEAVERLEHLSGEGYEWLTDDVKAGIIALYKTCKANRRKSIDSKKLGRPKNVESIKKAVGLYKKGGLTVKEITKVTGVARSTLYENIPQYIEEV